MTPGKIDDKLYRYALESTRAHAVSLLDPEGRISTWNEGARLIYHYEPPEIIGQHVRLLFPEADRQASVPENELRTAAATGVADDTRFMRTKDGALFWTEGNTAAIKADGGELLGFVKITRDASERRRLEQLLERSNEELQRFAFTVSHDLQEPLRTVKSYAELLSRRYQGRLDADADEFIRFMMDAAGRMTQLIKDLLAYSQAGRPDRTHRELTQLANVLQWALMNLSALIKETEAVVTYDSLPNVDADQMQMVQVFQNLIGNAIKFRRPDEAPRIHVGSAPAKNGFWLVSIQDNGIGIDPQYLERVFGVFKRLHGKEVPGTGIGLSICRKIIEAHGGQIWIESEPAKGTTVHFTLPADE
jgi:PAS domain S-box-containing protein